MSRSRATGNTRQLRVKLARMADGVEAAARDSVAASARTVQLDAIADAPFDPTPDGVHLREGIEVRLEKGGLRAEIGWFATKYYYGYWLEFGRKRAAPRPTMRPAGMRSRREFPRELERRLREVVDLAGR